MVTGIFRPIVVYFKILDDELECPFYNMKTFFFIFAEKVGV